MFSALAKSKFCASKEQILQNLILILKQLWIAWKFMMNSIFECISAIQYNMIILRTICKHGLQVRTATSQHYTMRMKLMRSNTKNNIAKDTVVTQFWHNLECLWCMICKSEGARLNRNHLQQKFTWSFRFAVYIRNSFVGIQSQSVENFHFTRRNTTDCLPNSVHLQNRSNVQYFSFQTRLICHVL